MNIRMIRYTAFLTALILICLSFTGCFYSIYKKQMAELNASSSSKSESDKSKTTESKTPRLGTYENPVKMGQEFTRKQTSYFGTNYTETIRVDSILMRGEKANEFIKENDGLYPRLAGENEEYIIFKLNVKVTDITNGTYYMKYWNLIKSDGMQIMNQSGVYIGDDLGLTDAESINFRLSGQVDAFLVFLVEKNTAQYLIYDDTYFFALS